MTSEPTRLEQALAAIVGELSQRQLEFALVGGLAISYRAEVRFTRDVDLVVVVRDDTNAEALIHSLCSRGYRTVATVEHEARHRLSTVRLLSNTGVKIDLLMASSGIEAEIARRASSIEIAEIGALPVARPEELLAMKVLSMTGQRLQDRLDAQRLLACCPRMDLTAVRDNLRLITERGYHRGQDLDSKLSGLLDEIQRPS